MTQPASSSTTGKDESRAAFIAQVLIPNHAAETSEWDRIGYTAWQASEARMRKQMGDLAAICQGFISEQETDCGEPDCPDCSCWRPMRKALAHLSTAGA